MFKYFFIGAILAIIIILAIIAIPAAMLILKHTIAFIAGFIIGIAIVFIVRSMFRKRKKV